MLIADLDWAFPRKYDNEGKVCYSYLFQNRLRAIANDLFILVVHNPPSSAVSLETRKSILYRIRGTFCFHLKSRENQVSVVHANASQGPPNALFTNVNNRNTISENIQYEVDLDSLPDGRESIYFVSGTSMKRATAEDDSQFIHRNQLVGILPFGTRIKRARLSADSTSKVEPMSTIEVTEAGLKLLLE